MSDVILIQPKVGPLESVLRHPMLPLALLNVSVFAWRDYKITIIDQRVERNWKEKLVKELGKDPICVGITSLTGEQISYALEAAKTVKRESEVPVVWGGVHSTLSPKQTLESALVDIVVQGEGEVTFFELLKRLEKKETMKGINGVWYKSKGIIKSNPSRPFIDLNKIPEVPYHLVDVSNYIRTISGKRNLVLQTSRGCPYRCAFCHQMAYNKRTWRALNAQMALQRIEQLICSFGINDLAIIDDNFFVDLKRTEAIVKGIINAGYNFTWYADARIDTVQRMGKSFLQLLERSGCRRLELGVESGSSRIMRLMKKDITLDQVIETNRKLQEFNIRPLYNFMAGFPTETRVDLQQTVRLMFKLLRENPKATVSMVRLFTPYPGTELFYVAKKHGFVEPSSLEGWSKYGWDKANYPWMTEKQRKMLESLYTASLFLDSRYEEIESRMVKFFGKIYRPVAKYRVRNLFFKCMLESKLEDVYHTYRKMH